MLDSINLSHKSLTYADIVKLAEDFKVDQDQDIRTLKLGFNDLRDEGAIFISSMLRQASMLTCLDLGFCSIGDRGMESLASSLASNTTIRILYLSGNLLSPVGFKHLGNALASNKTLVALYVTGNAAKAEGAKQLAKGLRFNYSIEKLFINGNKIDKDGASSLSDTLAANHTITHLNMSDNNIGDQGLMSLSEAMASHRNIRDLELSFNRITAVGIGSFIDSIAGYRNLSRLLLDNNKLCGSGAKSLALALPHMQLQELNIAFNDIDSEGLLAIIGSVAQSVCLKVLTLSGNTIDNAVSVSVAHMLSLNTTLSALYIDHTNLTSNGEKIIGSGIARNRRGVLQLLTGMDLGKVLVQLGSPAQLGDMSNENALRYLAQIWSIHDRQLQQSSSTKVSPSPSSASGLGDAGTQGNNAVNPALTFENAAMNTPSKLIVPTSVGQMTSPVALKYEDEVKKIRHLPAALAAARDLWALPFNSHDMWDLHQYFFSPPEGHRVQVPSESDTEDDDSQFSRANPSPDSSCAEDNVSLGSDVSRKKMVSNSHERPRCDSGARPKKRATNKTTVARIAYYPLIKTRLEGYKASVDEVKALTLLRQLRLLEKALMGVEPAVIEKLLLEE
eukprot:gene30615-36991_t